MNGGLMIGDKRPTTTGQGTIVGTNVKLLGTLQDASDIIIHGRIEGEVISSQAINVAETAYIKGPITGETVTVAGKVRGSITATSKMEILPTGQVFGSITSKDLSIRSGAIFVGKCTMPSDESKDEVVEVAEKEVKKDDATYEV